VAKDLSGRRVSKIVPSRKPTLVYFTAQERKIVDQAARVERRSLSGFIASVTLDAAHNVIKRHLPEKNEL
jgi:uncharacterized protein (DUF1778 family)